MHNLWPFLFMVILCLEHAKGMVITMIYGLGIDLCGIDRISRLIEKENFLKKVYTPEEREYIKKRGAPSAAGIFAAKEAVSKAMGTGFAEMWFTDIEIKSDASGKPCCHLTGRAAQYLKKLGADSVMVSITHEGDMAAAFAIVLSA